MHSPFWERRGWRAPPQRLPGPCLLPSEPGSEWEEPGPFSEGGSSYCTDGATLCPAPPLCLLVCPCGILFSSLPGLVYFFVPLFFLFA